MANTLRKMHAWLLMHEPDRGASLVEYALLVALIALVCFAAIGFLGGEASSRYDGMGSSLASSN